VSLRLFLSLEPSDGVRREAGRAVEHLAAALPGVRARYAAPDTVHLTLVFLGAVEEARVQALERAAAGVARTARPFTCSTGGLGAFPSARRPSVLWLGLDEEAEALSGLQRDLERALGGFLGRDEPKRFVPHLTLARVAGLGGTPREAVAEALRAFRPQRASWHIEAVVLFQSELRPEGARHTPLARLSLAAPAARGHG